MPSIILVLSVLVTAGAAALAYRLVRAVRQRRCQDRLDNYDLGPVSEEWRRDIRRGRQ